MIGAYALPFGLQYLDVDFAFPLVAVVSTYICLMELISAIENLGEVNPIIKKLFAPYLEKLKSKSEDMVDKNKKGK